MTAINRLLSRHPDLSPFSLDRHDDYLRWREAKLADRPAHTEELVVEVGDPRALTGSERGQLQRRLRVANMVIYAGHVLAPDKAIPRGLGRQFGLTTLDHNRSADGDGISTLTANEGAVHRRYIPYTDRPINWHTDGYYNAPDRQIRGLILHCVHSAAQGGENRLLDPELIYVHMRDHEPDYVRALMAPDAMTIPPGTDGEGKVRPAACGPVFSVDPGTGALHMRYTARKHNIRWKQAEATQEAVGFLEGLLNGDLGLILSVRLEEGMGLLCNNVLHTREAFIDAPQGPRRLLYRARYFERIAGTALRPSPHLS